MVITTLLENLSVKKEYKNKHGLCFHLKTNESNILFDLGPDETFIENAKKLNISIKDVDMVIISHGHSDHGGGLEAFLEENKKAKIYINKNAFGMYYTNVILGVKKYIGLNKELEKNERIIFTDDNFEINENMFLFSNVLKKELCSSSNKALYKKEDNNYIEDDFIHEQNLIIKDNGKKILMSGCSHCGMINILKKAKSFENHIDIAIGGLHLCKPITKQMEDEEFIKTLGNRLSKEEIKFYTGHCTGEKPFLILKEILKDKINYLKTGSILEV